MLACTLYRACAGFTVPFLSVIVHSLALVEAEAYTFWLSIYASQPPAAIHARTSFSLTASAIL